MADYGLCQDCGELITVDMPRAYHQGCCLHSPGKGLQRDEQASAKGVDLWLCSDCGSEVSEIDGYLASVKSDGNGGLAAKEKWED